MQTENKPKEYRIESLKQLVNIVNDENAERLATDMALWLIHTANVFKKLREAHTEETKDKTNWELAETYFIWVDDGEHNLLNTIITNKETGEITTHKH